MCYFLFFKQKTAYEMRISDWSSDVCSSDLGAGVPSGRAVTGGKAGLPAATKLDPVIRLYPAKAASRSGALRFGPAELSVMLPFLGAGELLWTVEVAEPGE